MSSISDKILGAEGSMSEVGIPPPHNLYKPNTPVAGNYHTIPITKLFTPVIHFIIDTGGQSTSWCVTWNPIYPQFKPTTIY